MKRKRKPELEHLNEIFLHKKEDRKIRLFTLLKNAPIRGIQVNELAEAYSNSRKTMHSDLKELKQDLIFVYKKALLNEYPTGTFYLDIEKTVLTQKLLLYYMKKSRNFWVFTTIAKNKKTSFITLKENLYYSQSTIYDSIKKLNHALRPLAISCSSAGVIGDEKKIRHLLFESYWSVFGGIEWPFSIKREIFEKEIKKLEQVGGLFTDLEREKILYWLAITEMRLTIGQQLSNQNQRQFRQKKNTLHSFFEKSCSKKHQENNFQEEYLFLIGTSKFFLDIPLDLTERRVQKKITEPIFKIENQLLLRGENSNLSISEMAGFIKILEKINYFSEEMLVDWYHFIEPNALIYLNENDYFIEKKWRELLAGLSDEIKSMYLLEAEKSGLTLMKPLRIKILSKEGNTLEIGQFFKKYSLYPIEISQKNDVQFDVLVTNFVLHSQNKEENPACIFFEWPLTQPQLYIILEQAKHFRKS